MDCLLIACSHCRHPISANALTTRASISVADLTLFAKRFRVPDKSIFHAPPCRFTNMTTIHAPVSASVKSGIQLHWVPDNIYTPTRTAVRELRKRRRDLDLLNKVEKDMRIHKYPAMKIFKRPCAVLFRQVGTPIHEILRFFGQSKDLGLKPVIFEYQGDKFVSANNSYKRGLGKMPIYQFTGSDGRDMVHFKTIFDMNKYGGKKFSDILCHTGEPLVDFHHRLLCRIAKINTKNHCVDGTEWLQESGGTAPRYYETFLTLFVRNAILFESYLPRSKEETFIQAVVEPAFQTIEKKYGHRPLIVRLLPEHDEKRKFWEMYPKKLERIMEL